MFEFGFKTLFLHTEKHSVSIESALNIRVIGCGLNRNMSRAVGYPSINRQGPKTASPQYGDVNRIKASGPSKSASAQITMSTIVLTIVLSMVLGQKSIAQTINPEYAIGTSPYQTYHGGDIDSVSTYNGGLSLKIPLMSYPQRGTHLKLDFAAQYNGKPFTFQILCIPGFTPCHYLMMPQVLPNVSGFSIVDTQHLYAYPKTYQECPAGDTSPTDGSCLNQYLYYPEQVVSADGSVHYGAVLGTDTSLPAGTSQETLDGTAIRYNGGPTSSSSGTSTCPSFGGCTLTDSQGTTYFSSGTVLREDVDGNTISATGRSSYLASGTITDTMGRSVQAPPGITTTDTSGCTGPLPISSVKTWTVPGAEGTDVTYTFCYATIPIRFPTVGTCATASPADSGAPYGSPANTPMLQSIILPNGSTWTFEYDARASGDPSTINFGELTKVTFPTGGSISYQYALRQRVSSNDFCSAWVTSRSVDANDGTGPHTWTYNYAGVISGVSGTVVTDPAQNVEQYIYGIAAPSVTEQKSFQYTSTGLVLKKDVKTSYMTQAGISDGQPPFIGIFPTTVITTLDGSKTTQQTMAYCCSVTVSSIGYGGITQPNSFNYNYGIQYDLKDYDYGSGAPGSLLREQKTAYLWQTNSNYLTANILSTPSSTKTLNAAGTTVAETDYTYDQASYLTASGVSTQHVTPPNLIFGHATTTTNMLLGGTSPQWHTNWYDTGVTYQQIDPKGYTTTYTYGSTYAGALPTSVTNASGQTTTIVYDFNTGQKSSITDANSQTTSYDYSDPLGRLKKITYPDLYPGTTIHGETDIQYNDTGSIGTTVTQKISPTLNKQIQSFVDGLGRLSGTTLLTDTSGVTKTNISYDALGRKYQQWNPYRTTSDSTYGVTTYGYDNLGRMVSRVDPDGTSTQTWTFSGNMTTVSDESGNQWSKTVDGLGRTQTVLEPNGTSTTPSLQTDYLYDTLGNLTKVTQWGGASGSAGARIRSFTYDSLSRLITASSPEAGATCYGTWSGANCINGYDLNSNLTARTDARGITTSYTYDALNRLTQKSYSDGVTPPALFGYDAESITMGTTGFSTSNVIGRPSWTCILNLAGNACLSMTAFSYDALGRTTQLWQMVDPSVSPSGVARKVAYSYDLAGNITSSTNGLTAAANALSFNYSYSGAGRLQQAAVTTQPPTWSALTYPPILMQASSTSPASYDPAGRLVNAKFGLPASLATAAVTVASQYDNRGRIVSESAGSLYSYTVPVGGYSLNGNLLLYSDTVTGSWNFQYDTLNRLISARASSGAFSGETGCWTYDAFGNRTLEAFSTTTTTPCTAGANDNAQRTSATYTTHNNNRIDAFTYDASGNVTYDGQNGYAYDPEGRLCAVSYNLTGTTAFVQYFYNASGERVAKGSVSGLTCSQPLISNGFALNRQYLLGKQSEVITELDGSGAPVHTNIRLGGTIATYDFTNGGLHFALADPLGTKRVQVSGTGVAEIGCASLPFGNNLGNTRITDCSPIGSSAALDATEHHFTGKERDQESGNDYFGARYYASSMGRFMSPDPLLASGHPGNPQTWNRYAYAGNNPLRNIDPTGLYFLKNTCTPSDAACNAAFADTQKNVRAMFAATKTAYDKAIASGDSKAAGALKRTLDGLGAEGEKNARGQTVNISADTKLSTPGDTNFEKGSTTTINIRLNPTGENESGQADAAHEGVHAGEITPGRFTLQQAYAQEHDAYETESFFAQSIGYSDNKTPADYTPGPDGVYDLSKFNWLWRSNWADLDAATIDSLRTKGVNAAAKDGAKADCAGQEGGCK